MKISFTKLFMANFVSVFLHVKKKHKNQNYFLLTRSRYANIKFISVSFKKKDF